MASLTKGGLVAVTARWQPSTRPVGRGSTRSRSALSRPRCTTPRRTTKLAQHAWPSRRGQRCRRRNLAPEPATLLTGTLAGTPRPVRLRDTEKSSQAILQTRETRSPHAPRVQAKETGFRGRWRSWQPVEKVIHRQRRPVRDGIPATYLVCIRTRHRSLGYLFRDWLSLAIHRDEPWSHSPKTKPSRTF